MSSGQQAWAEDGDVHVEDPLALLLTPSWVNSNLLPLPRLMGRVSDEFMSAMRLSIGSWMDWSEPSHRHRQSLVGLAHAAPA